MRFGFILLCCLMGATFVGCGGPERVAPPTSAEVGEGAKRSIQEFITEAKKSPKTAASKLALLNESLVAYAREFDGEFVTLHETAVELQKMYEQKAGQAEIDQQLEKLSKAADAVAASE